MAEKTQTPVKQPEAPQAQNLVQQVPPAAQPQAPVDETTKEAPEAAVVAAPDVKIRSNADATVTVSVPAGTQVLEPGKDYEVSAAFAEQAAVLDSVERV